MLAKKPSKKIAAVPLRLDTAILEIVLEGPSDPPMVVDFRASKLLMRTRARHPRLNARRDRRGTRPWPRPGFRNPASLEFPSRSGGTGLGLAVRTWQWYMAMADGCFVAMLHGEGLQVEFSPRERTPCDMTLEDLSRGRGARDRTRPGLPT
jgi:hypothetical protein